jgi:hypothetical protein
MTAKILSNRSAYFRGGADGIGGRNLPDGLISWVGIVSNAATDVMYLSAADCTSSNHPYLAYTLQAVGGNVTVEFTCQNIGTSTNPDPNTQSMISWCNSVTVQPGTFSLITYGFAAMKISFSAAGTEFYVVAR